jgi:hypothetical protein
MGMASRVGLLVVVLLAAGALVTSSAARTPPRGNAIFVLEHDPRLCPTPLCGGYWVALANGARTRCPDGLRRPRCYVARLAGPRGSSLTGAVSEGSLARGAIATRRTLGDRMLDELVVSALYAPAGTATPGGGYYRVTDTGIRCVRAPCFSVRVTQVNGSTRTTTSSVDLGASGATSAEISRARAAIHSRDGLYARGRFARAPDGGRVFRGLRLYLRAPLPRA